MATMESCKGEHERFVGAFLRQVLRDHDLPASAYKIAAVLGQYLNRASREAWPSQKTIMAATALSEASVRRLIGLLRRRGYLTTTPSKGRGRSPRYQLVIVEMATEKGSPASPDLLKRVANATLREGERRARARENPDSFARAADAAAKEDPKEEIQTATAKSEGKTARQPAGAGGRQPAGKAARAKSGRKAESDYLELRKIWARPWCDNDGGEAWLLYDQAVREVGAGAIATGAKSWVESADHPRFLPKLSSWLAARGWARRAPGRAQPPKAAKAPASTGGRRYGRNRNPDLAAITLRGGRYVEHLDGTISWDGGR